VQLTKHGHACVRLALDGLTVVIDPGAFTDLAVFDGADAVLITHEHADHFAEDAVRKALDAQPALTIWSTASVAATLGDQGGRVHAVGDGDSFTIGDHEVTVHGELHEVIHPDMPRVRNVGFHVAGVFHPGDAFTVPGKPVDTLLLPISAPWLRVRDVIDYAREVQPRRAFAVHDVMLSDIGLMVYGNVLGANGPGIATDYARLAPGESAGE